MIRFDDYMSDCLYGPDGFYSQGHGIAGGRGRGGDFITSPEVGALFGAVVARQVDAWWDELGQPDPFVVINAGDGPGTLTRSLAAAEPRCAQAWQLLSVDPAPLPASASELPGQRLTELPADLTGAVIIANELLDNLVFRIVARADDGSWNETFVDPDPATGPVPVYRPTTDPGLDLAPGQVAPVLDAAGAWVSDVLARGAARVLAFDYGVATTRALAERGGWLRTYHQHGRGHDPFVHPGRIDITTDIAVDQLPVPSHFTSQAEWLEANGMSDLVEEGRQYWQAHAARPDLAAMRMRSRVSEARTLRDPDALGSWLAILWQAGEQ